MIRMTKAPSILPIAATLVLGFLSLWGTVVPAAADPRKAASAQIGKPFAIRSGQEVAVGTLKVRMTADHRPFERGPGGLEQFPYTFYRLEWKEGADRLVIPQVSRRENGQFPLFGRYTFTFGVGRDEDEATITVFKRWCLLRYTSSNQLQHPDGKIIFDITEDLCCYYSDGKNNCDLRVTRAQAPRAPDARYCVVYSNQKKSAEESCCCRFEKGETIEPACQSQCDRLTAAGK